jgi:hypothetical protein
VIDSWLNLPLAAVLAVLAAFYLSTGALIYFLAFGTPTRRYAQTLSGVVAPFFGCTAILFALLTGFLGSDVSDRIRQARRAVQTEATALATVHTVSIAAASDMAPIRAALQAYARATVSDEWPTMGSETRSRSADTALADLLREVSDPQIASQAGQAVHSALMNAVVQVRNARADRLELAQDRTHQLKWLTVLILGLMTQIALGLVHLERPRAHLAALAVFSLAAVSALGLIAVQESPFEGAINVSPAPIEHEVLASGPVG